ncbi:MAG: AraC family transcriptional regulator [Chitinophagaceae bacterium]
MKPALEHLPREKGESFVVKYFDYKYYPTPWHYHPEYEIVLVTESTGRRLIGDHVCNFQPGNLAFIGSNLPHIYRNDENYYKPKSKLRAKSIVIHFSEASLGKDFLDLPEAKIVKAFLQQSEKGFDITGSTNQYISLLMEKIVSLNGLKRWLCLTEILNSIAESKELQVICNSSVTGKNEKESDRLCLVFDWILHNYDRDLRVTEAADLCSMSVNAFSRFFSMRTRKTFSAYVADLRLNKAAKLLAENKLSVSDICYDCGFNNISNFNRQFLKHYEVNPLKYRKTFLEMV